MRREGNRIILENRIELNEPIFKGGNFSTVYREHSEGNRGLVMIGFQTANDPNWLDLEVPWDWLPKDVQVTAVKFSKKGEPDRPDRDKN